MNQANLQQEPEWNRKRRLIWLAGIVPLVVVAVAVWWLVSQRQAAAEQEAIAKLRQLGAIVQLDSQREHAVTAMLRENIKEAIPLIADLVHLTHLDVADSDFGDEEAEYLTGMSRLRSLVLSNTQITDATVERLADLPLESFLLAGTSITPAALDTISGMRQVQVLDLANTRVEDNLLALAEASSLEWLVVSGVDLTGIGQAEVDMLAQLPKLVRVTLKDTQIDAKWVDRLKQAKPSLIVEAGASENIDSVDPSSR